MKFLNLLFRFRLWVMLGAGLFVFTVQLALAQDPVSILQSLPEDFKWAWVGIAIIGMPLHWLKQAIWKEVAWDTFDDHFFKNLQWTVSAVLSIIVAVALDTEMLKVQPIFSSGVIITLLMIGFNVDSGINSPGNKLSNKPPDAPNKLSPA